jgi:hypothetical protein
MKTTKRPNHIDAPDDSLSAATDGSATPDGSLSAATDGAFSAAPEYHYNRNGCRQVAALLSLGCLGARGPLRTFNEIASQALCFALALGSSRTLPVERWPAICTCTSGG